MREEYPRPSLVRERWLNLNGEWEFEIAPKCSDLLDKPKYQGTINVPFCPESALSGVQHKGFMEHLYYRRDFEVSEGDLAGKLLLHFGAVDYHAIVYVNKRLAGEHYGGYVGFTLDITDFVKAGRNVLDVEVFDDTKSHEIPSGKQSMKEQSHGCYYTRTTGIWQTVWLEYVSKSYISDVKIDADPATLAITLHGSVKGLADTATAVVGIGGAEVAKASARVNGGNFVIGVQLSEIKLWDTVNPNLYDIELTLESGEKEFDKLNTYTAFRTFEVVGKEFRLNGERIFLKSVLDQGFYPDGIYTAPDVAAIERDIDDAMALGFNSARPHQKVFEEHYLYYADKKGFLLWGEYPSWGVKFTKRCPAGVNNFIREWREAIARDYNHPSIIGWCPLNEAWSGHLENADYGSSKEIERVTREEGGKRVYIGASGGRLFGGDVNDIHCYEHASDKLNRRLMPRSGTRLGVKEDILYANKRVGELKHALRDAMPTYLSEYGGASYLAGEGDWGYHEAMTGEEEFIDLFIELTDVAHSAGVAGVCYTQLYDVEQECNGILRYDRSHKLSPDGESKIKAALDNLR